MRGMTQINEREIVALRQVAGLNRKWQATSSGFQKPLWAIAVGRDHGARPVFGENSVPTCHQLQRSGCRSG
jgi:hypothetical protein